MIYPITIVSIGPDSADLLTLGAVKELEKAKILYLRTQMHGVVKYLKKTGINFSTLDDCYNNSEDFDEFTKKATDLLIGKAKTAPLTYAVPDPAHDETVRCLMMAAKEHVKIIPGVSLCSPMVVSAFPGQTYLITEASKLEVKNAHYAICVVELNSQILAGEVKLKLLPKFGEYAQVVFFPPSKAALREGITIFLIELDRQPKYDHTTGFIVFPQSLLTKTQFDSEDLLTIMRRLRSPEGCPWDREQTHQSLIKHLIEEANEAAAALQEEDWQAAAEELGDVLLQIAFHAVVGEEYGTMTWEEVLNKICTKLIRRHPHIFGEMHLETAGEVLDTWEKIKQKERGDKRTTDAMLAVSKGLPPMIRAEKIQKAAARVGFDWENPRDALQKVIEEAEELNQVIDNPQCALDEAGDLLFSCVNTTRLIGIQADQALHLAIEKFIKRFDWMEKAIENDKKSLKLLTINELEVYWKRSKMKTEGFHNA